MGAGLPSPYVSGLPGRLGVNQSCTRESILDQTGPDGLERVQQIPVVAAPRALL